MPNLWILREESGEIVGCVFAKVQSKEDNGKPFVYIGLLAVKVGNQVEVGWVPTKPWWLPDIFPK